MEPEVTMPLGFGACIEVDLDLASIHLVNLVPLDFASLGLKSTCTYIITCTTVIDVWKIHEIRTAAKRQL